MGCKDAVPSAASSTSTIADHLDFLDDTENLEFDFSNGQDKLIEDHLWVKGSSDPVSVRHAYSKILIYPKTATTIWEGKEYVNTAAEPGMGPITGIGREFQIKERHNRLCLKYLDTTGEYYLLEFTQSQFYEKNNLAIHSYCGLECAADCYGATIPCSIGGQKCLKRV
jgi:hypothetical protein